MRVLSQFTTNQVPRLLDMHPALCALAVVAPSSLARIEGPPDLESTSSFGPGSRSSISVNFASEKSLLSSPDPSWSLREAKRLNKKYHSFESNLSTGTGRGLVRLIRT